MLLKWLLNLNSNKYVLTLQVQLNNPNIDRHKWVFVINKSIFVQVIRISCWKIPNWLQVITIVAWSSGVHLNIYLSKYIMIAPVHFLWWASDFRLSSCTLLFVEESWDINCIALSTTSRTVIIPIIWTFYQLKLTFRPPKNLLVEMFAFCVLSHPTFW